MTSLDRTMALSVLREGRILLMDTDTVPGLHVRAADPAAAQRLGQLKGSTDGRPFLLLVADVESAFRIGRPADPGSVERLGKLWPGPLTALLVPEPETPGYWIHESRSVGVRVPGSLPLREFLREFGEPVFSTSANRSGAPPARTLGEAAAEFPDLDVIRIGTSGSGASSTIVDFTVEPPRLVRAGTAAFEPDSGGSAPA